MNQRYRTFLHNYWEVVLAFLAILIIYYYIKKKGDYTDNNGIITVAKVVRQEVAESGSSLHINIYLRDKIIPASVGNDCYNCIDKFFFVKVRKDIPANYPILYTEKPVPNCIIKSVQYFKGWDDFPTCSNY
jgi:hypothetical protein